jgi:hypothetical protein
LGIDLKGVHELKRRFLGIALVQILDSSFVELLLSSVGIPGASRRYKAAQENNQRQSHTPGTQVDLHHFLAGANARGIPKTTLTESKNRSIPLSEDAPVRSSSGADSGGVRDGVAS